MHAMQYEITLPADYDMDIVRERVATRGRALDGHPGLAFKAYLIRERGTAGSPVNQYAPFYLWHDPGALTGFLRGSGFRGLSADFGRPAVRNWHGLALEPGPAQGAAPRAAERLTYAIGEDEDAAERVERALEETREAAREPGTHSVVLGLDPHRWELARLVLLEGRREERGASQGARYEVLHLSEGTR
ncbi:DUF4865 family protein [Streptomyces glaucosporus]|uniref:DUF4865 family protein n=1 Tax=Streptomyces glaucosporus TaxID=284044 RepID=A0ABN3I8H0_9ACTN